MKPLIKKLLREALEEVKLVSKSKKGNRNFKCLKTAKFQHYDMPKGDLATFSKGEEDRKRLVSKLSKEDKKTYRAWIKTPEGEKSLKIWDDITKDWEKRIGDIGKVNESSRKADKYGDMLKVEESNFGFEITIPEYKTRVKDSLVDIITNDRGISEKSFSEYDNVIKEVGMLKYDGEVGTWMEMYERKGSRPEYVAEKIYDEFIFTK